MVKLGLSVTDLAAARYTISPVHEVVGSLWTLYGVPGCQPPRHWLRRTRSHRGLDHDLLRSLVSPRCWTPDFVAPPPRTARPPIGTQLAQVRVTPPDKVIADVFAAYGPAPLPSPLRELANDPVALRDRVAATLEQYWRIAIAPHWPRMRILLEADLMHRGLELALGGPEAAFAGLDRRIAWHDGTLTVNVIRHWHREIPVGGRGLRLLPSLFVTFPHLPIDVRDPPVVAYPSRGQAILWQEPARPATAAGTAISSLIGQPRARLLAMLGDAASTTELACRLGVTPSAVSQHLRVLAAAGLVTRARAGRVVLYRRSTIGAWLVTERCAG